MGKLSYSKAKFGEIFGYSADDVGKMEVLDIAIESDRPVVAENIRKRLTAGTERVEYVILRQRKDGTVIDVEIHSSAVMIDGTLELISLFMDVTERKCAEREVRALQEELREQAIHDPLTGLYNRRYLEKP